MLIGNAVGLSYLLFQEKLILKINFQPTDVQLLMNIEQQSTGHQSQIWIPIKRYRRCWSNDWPQLFRNIHSTTRNLFIAKVNIMKLTAALALSQIPAVGERMI